MQWLVDLIFGFVALLAAVALSQFGLDVDAPSKPTREVHRVRDCGQDGQSAVFAVAAERKPEC